MGPVTLVARRQKPKQNTFCQLNVTTLNEMKQ